MTYFVLCACALCLVRVRTAVINKRQVQSTKYSPKYRTKYQALQLPYLSTEQQSFPSDRTYFSIRRTGPLRTCKDLFKPSTLFAVPSACTSTVPSGQLRTTDNLMSRCCSLGEEAISHALHFSLIEFSRYHQFASDIAPRFLSAPALPKQAL